MNTPFCVTIKDPDTGNDVLFDIEGTVDADLDWSPGGPSVSFSAIYVNGVDLFRSGSTALKLLASDIADLVADDPDTIDALIEDTDFEASRADRQRRMQLEVM